MYCAPDLAQKDARLSEKARKYKKNHLIYNDFRTKIVAIESLAGDYPADRLKVETKVCSRQTSRPRL